MRTLKLRRKIARLRARPPAAWEIRFPPRRRRLGPGEEDTDREYTIRTLGHVHGAADESPPPTLAVEGKKEEAGDGRK